MQALTTRLLRGSLIYKHHNNKSTQMIIRIKRLSLCCSLVILLLIVVIHSRIVRLLSDGLLIVLSNYFFVTDEDYLLHVVNQEGQKKFELGRVTEEEYSTLKAEGYLLVDEEDNIYYSGYSEHILKKWNREGDLL